ncbi:helix-turn-helix domain-containing protein [Altererythrobacter aerius]|uniref:Helix-turn-helix domain-containing protein n=1 Tax=Tsuneonella aeria TaxID=1837929 RepID=A0A6I4TGQ9_9SPHN|nr:helix-turn-helix domain-containing protein [Tsuneonella aeria]MXO75220.1 helix-turn-helix domain-containing protein [Tsuneonella aeria]
MPDSLKSAANGALEPFDRFVETILSFDCDRATRDAFRRLAYRISAEPGESMRLDDSRDSIVFMASGAAKLVAHVSDDRQQVVAFHFAGDLVSVPQRNAHAYELCALTHSVALAFPAAAYMALADAEPALLRTMIDRTLLALNRSREKSVALGRKTAPERVTGFIASMADRIGTREGAGCTIRLPMSRRDIADSLGLTIETVSRQFTDLRGEGVIETSGRSAVRVPNLAALRARAAGPNGPAD